MNRTNNNNALLQKALQTIVLGASKDRIDRAPSGMGGVGTARMIYGWVSKIHDDPNDYEFEDYGGTIDVTEYSDESTTGEPFTYKGVLLSGKKDRSGGFLIIPYLYSDVAILVDAGTDNKHVVNFSHADFVQVDSHKASKIGATETEEMDINDNDSPDYDELPETGNKSYTEYTPSQIVSVVKDKDGNIYKRETNSFGYTESVGDTEVKVSDKVIQHKVGEQSIMIQKDKVYLGGISNEPAVKGLKLTLLLKNLISTIAQITVPTLAGTMPIINAPDFLAMVNQVDTILSEFVFVK